MFLSFDVFFAYLLMTLDSFPLWEKKHYIEYAGFLGGFTINKKIKTMVENTLTRMGFITKQLSQPRAWALLPYQSL